jgi:hypothetical protein
MKKMVGRTLSVHKEHELLLKLEKAGLNEELAQEVIDSKGNNLAIKMVRLITSDGLEATASQKRACEIMGKNFFGIEDAIKHLRINPTSKQLAALAEIPFSVMALEELKDTHILIAVFPLSILEIRGRIERNLFHSYEDSWYNKESFAKERGKVGWELVRKTPVEDSISKNWQQQRSLLSKNDEVPSAQIMVYTIIGHYLSTGERLFKNIYVRTSSLDAGGHRVDVGVFDSDGLVVGYCWNSYYRGDVLGVSSARKLPA